MLSEKAQDVLRALKDLSSAEARLYLEEVKFALDERERTALQRLLSSGGPLVPDGSLSKTVADTLPKPWEIEDAQIVAPFSTMERRFFERGDAPRSLRFRRLLLSGLGIAAGLAVSLGWISSHWTQTSGPDRNVTEVPELTPLVAPPHSAPAVPRPAAAKSPARKHAVRARKADAEDAFSARM
jgi:hypothetical protein